MDCCLLTSRYDSKREEKGLTGIVRSCETVLVAPNSRRSETGLIYSKLPKVGVSARAGAKLHQARQDLGVSPAKIALIVIGWRGHESFPPA